jgi:hypothetical protein
MLTWRIAHRRANVLCWVFAATIKSWLLEIARRLGLSGLRLQLQPAAVPPRPNVRKPNCL